MPQQTPKAPPAVGETADRSASLPPYDPDFARQVLLAAGLKPLNRLWAKLEIVLGLSAAVLGLVLLRDRAVHDWAAGALIVLGAYLAAAGHRSHLYQSQNRQAAWLLQVLRGGGRG